MTAEPSVNRVSAPKNRLAEQDARSLSAAEVSALKVAPRRRYGRWAIGAALIILTTLLLQTLLTNKNIDKSVIEAYLFSPEILLGLQHTLIITFWSMVVALVLGTVIATMRISNNPLASWLASSFAFFFRGSPVLVQLFFWFNLALIFPHLQLGIPGTNVVLATWDTNDVMTPLVASVIALGLTESAYYSEIVRSGLISVDPGQREAAQSIGMSGFQTFRKIVLPQTIRIILPPTGNELIGMLKFSSLASVIGYTDLAGTAAQIYAVNVKTIELLIVISFWYFAATTVLSVGQYYLERRYGRGYGRSSETSTLASRIWSNLKFRSSRA
jgi:polar amino acid transport system permease protein